MKNIKQYYQKLIKFNPDKALTIYITLLIVNNAMSIYLMGHYKPELSSNLNFFYLYLFLVMPMYMLTIYLLSFQVIEKGRWIWGVLPLLYFSYFIFNASSSGSVFDIHPSIATFYDEFISLPLLFLNALWIMCIVKQSSNSILKRKPITK
jgi:hypothetical protein